MQFPHTALWHIFHLITKETASVIKCSIVDRRQDYYSVLYGITAHNISRLQHMQNSLAHTICHALYRLSTMQLHRSLHWLPIDARITFQVAVLKQNVRQHHQLTYLSSTIFQLDHCCQNQDHHCILSFQGSCPHDLEQPGNYSQIIRLYHQFPASI